MMAINKEVEYTLRLTGGGGTDLTKTVQVKMVLASAIDTTDSLFVSIRSSLFSIPLDFNGASYQIYSLHKDNPLPAEGDPFFQDEDSHIVPTEGIFCVTSLNT